MFTITLKGKPDKNRPDFVKITMVIYRPGYNRVPKILPVTGLYKHWDQSQQRFKPKTENAAANNALLASTVNKYLQVGNAWDDQQVRWTPKELSHYYDKPREVMLRETVVPTVEQVYRKWICDIRETKKMKNGHEVPCEAYAKANERILDFLTRFVKEKYDRAFSNLEFTDITEQFLKDYVFYIESEGAKKGNRGGLRGKLHSLYQVVKKAEKKGIPGADVDAFVCTNEKFREQEHEPSTISLTLLKAMESMDRSLISEKESYYLDLFLFCFYCGGIAPIDAAYLTWPCIDMKKRKITYERIKTPKKGRPPFVPRAEKIAAKYKDRCYADYVLPIFGKQHDTHEKKKNRMGYMCDLVNAALRRIVGILGFDEEITWYSARGTYITMMVDKKYPPGVVAEHSGNSIITIYKFYWKNQSESDIISELCEEFSD